ncbi:MAG: Apolipoprotein N-acyltransferase [Phycisphaerae bacterium]|nr:Apolipoprotein N-acyltransferase [Phycisphaerae bacterium]
MTQRPTLSPLSADSSPRPLSERFWTCSLLVLVLGAMLGATYLWPVTWWNSWISLAALFLLLRGVSARRAFWYGWLYGLAFHATTAYWIAATLERFARFHLLIAHPLCLLLHGYAGLQIALILYLYVKLHRRPGDMLWLLPAIWVTGEKLWFNLFPWSVGQMQAPWITLIQLAEVTGVYGISFIVVMGAALIAFAWSRWRDQRQKVSTTNFVPLRRRLLWPVTSYALILTVMLVWGRWRMNFWRAEMAAAALLPVGLVQSGDPNDPEVDVHQELRERSRAMTDTAQLIVWPESSAGVYELGVDDLPRAFPAGKLADLQRPLPDPQCYLLCCGASYTQESRKQKLFYNSAVLINPQEIIIGRYHKRVLIPFGEYIPGESTFPGLRRFSPFDLMNIPGHSAEPLMMNEQARIGVLICYEDLLAPLARETTRNGATLLANLTNDFWFGKSTALSQHQQLALFRAIENRRYLLRSTMTGSTSVINPLGEVIAQAPLYISADLQATVHPLTQLTFYTRWGDLFAWVCLLLIILQIARKIIRKPVRT